MLHCYIVRKAVPNLRIIEGETISKMLGLTCREKSEKKELPGTDCQEQPVSHTDGPKYENSMVELLRRNLKTNVVVLNMQRYSTSSQ